MNITYARRAVYAFLLRPRWLVRHVLVLLAVALFALAGVWQVRRLDERREQNALIAARRSAPPASLDNVLSDPLTAEHRRVTANGRYDVAHEVILLGRGNGDQPGNHVLTPLVEGRRAVLVDRGWVPQTVEKPPARGAEPPQSTVTVHGELLGSERGPFRSGNASGGVVSIVDLRLIGRGLPYELAPYYVHLASQSPQQSGRLPVAVKPRVLGNGPHLSYALQWFSFIAIALIGYVAFVRHEARRTAAQPGAG